MPLYVVTMSHPEGDAWGHHVRAHVDWIRRQIADGRIRAAGRVRGLPLRSGMLICKAEDRDDLDALIATDPFAQEGLIAALAVTEWDPLFGALAADSSGDTAEID